MLAWQAEGVQPPPKMVPTPPALPPAKYGLTDFVPKAKKKPTAPVLNMLTDNNKMKRIPTKTNSIYIVFQVLKVLLVKSYKNNHQIFYFLLLLLAFTSTEIIFHKFLELHSTLSEKQIFISNFPPTPLMERICTNGNESFLLILPKMVTILKNRHFLHAPRRLPDKSV